MEESSSKGELREVPLMTEKGYSHRRDVLWSQMQRTFKVMQKQIQILNTLTASGDSGDPDMVYTESETLRRLYQDITNANNQFASCIKKDDPSESEKADDENRSGWIEEVDRIYFECKSRVCAWIGEHFKTQSTSSRQSRASVKTRDKSGTLTPKKVEPDLGLIPQESTATRVTHMMDETEPKSGKGEIQRCKLLQAQMKRSSKLMGKQMEIIEALFSSSDVDTVNTETSSLDRLHQEISDANAQLQWCYAHMDPSDVDVDDPRIQELWMEGIDEAYFQQKQKICNWLIKKDRTHKANRKRASSLVSGASGSSRASKRSKAGSDVSRTSRMSTEQRAKIASLKAEADMLQRTKEAELKAEMLTIQREIAKAEAKAQVYDEEEKRFASLTEAVKNDQTNPPAKAAKTQVDTEEEKRVTFLTEAAKNDQIKPSPLEEKISHESPREASGEASTAGKRTLRTLPEASEEVSASLVSAGQVLQETMSKMLKVQAAPTVVLDVFSGDPLEYAYFKATFKEVVEKTVDDQKGRLTRLIQYTSGEAKNLIRHLIHVSGDGYDQALKILDSEYGDVHTVTNSYLKELRLWPAIRANDSVAFKNFHQFLVKCLTYKEGVRLLELDSADVIRNLVLKLHQGYHERWNRVATKIRLKKDRAAAFKDFVDFVEGEKKLLCNPMYSKEALAESQTKLKSNNTLVGKKETKDEAPSREVKFKVCCNCDGNHDIEDCKEYLDLPIEERHKLVFLKKLCFCCLQPISDQHKAQQCSEKRQCKACNKWHPTTLHGDKSFSSHAVTSSTEMVSMCIVMVELWHAEEGKRVKVYALLDECCQGTLIREDIVETMGVTNISYKEGVSIQTVVGDDESQGLYVEGLMVRGVAPFTQHYEETEIKLPSTYLRPFLAMGEDDVATPSNIRNWDYLDKIKHMIPEYDPSVPFGLMIGGNCPLANEPWEFVHSDGKGPYAKRTPLGWCIVGPISSEGRVKTMKSNFTKVVAPRRDVSNNKVPTHYFHFQSAICGTITSRFLQEMYSREFNEYRSEAKAPSREDEYFLQVMENGLSRNGPHYVLPLPFRNLEVNLPNNREAAAHRLRPLKRRFIIDRELHKVYTKSMNKLINLGYARIADKTRDTPGKFWFIPHHAVISEKKDKPRVVFDCNSRYKGRSLNDELVQGPDLVNRLTGVLIRFREEDIAIMGDIEGMYFQVQVPEEQRSFLRFLWWPDGNLELKPVEYEMCTHVFGATSSGGCANYALKQAAKDGKAKFGHEAADTLDKNFYVDDLLKSVKDTCTAIQLVSNVSGMCSDGGFNLTKIVSNDAEVVNSLPMEKRAPALQESVLSRTHIERPLGVHWHVVSDTFNFSMTFKDTCGPRSRSSLLSTITSIFDPLGLVAPFLLGGMKITQAVTKLKGSWDDEVPQELMMRWEEWRTQLIGLMELQINRCYKPKGFTPVSTSLHCFSDACKIGYGQATYIRHVDKEGKIWVSLVMGKSRVVPDKPSTVPRLELTAAKTSALVGTMVKDELSFPIDEVTFWVDSMIVLGYILNETKRFRVFVANKVKSVRDYTAKKQWRYVETGSNPADHASRGITTNEAEKVHTWLNGAQFLWQPEDTWGVKDIEEIPDDDQEVLPTKKTKCNLVKVNDEDKSLLSRLESLYSCWHYILIILATMLKFIAKCRGTCTSSILTVKGMQEARNTMFKMIQAEHFSSELQQPPRKKGRFGQLDPFIAEDGLLRVGGRMLLSHIGFDVKHPIILPKESTAVRHLVRWHHHLIEHEGRTSTINEMRDNGYWVLGINSLVRNLIHNCFDCRANRGKTVEQKMANLPEERLLAEGPFVHCGLDMFGHYIVKEGRKELKRWGILFTCLSCRGIHLEMVYKADTDSFILALRRFMARRGAVRSIRSDNGGNFIGASNEFEKAYKEMDHNKIRKFLLSKQCDMIEWRRNPPESSHKGGVWERQIRSAKNVLNNLLRKHPARLNNEALSTFLTEVESIVNSRPLTVDNLGDESVDTLSPFNLLTMKSKVVLQPPGDFQAADIYCRKRWRTVQYLANVFWSRWRKEFLSSLQCRQKWKNPTRNTEVGDIVLIKDSHSCRNKWPIGRVMEVYPGEDGLVRTVQVRTATNKEPLTRSVAKIVLLVEHSETQQ